MVYSGDEISFEESVNDNDKSILDHTFGVCIVFLRAKSHNQSRPDLSYHLHFLLSKTKNSKIFMLCLDNGTSTFGLKSNISEMLNNLCAQFVDYIFYSINRNISDIREHVLLNKASTEFWNKFNEIKEVGFFKGIENEIYNINQNINIEADYLYSENEFSIQSEVVEYREAS